MSIEARQTLCSNPRLTFTDESQKSDLLNPDLTSTYLIAMLQWMLDNCDEELEILAVRSDHPTSDGSWAHSGGKAVDFYPSHWEMREQEAVCNVLKALSKNPYCEAVGLGGITRAWESYVTWPMEHFVVFDDNDLDHLHAGTANAIDPEGMRL